MVGQFRHELGGTDLGVHVCIIFCLVCGFMPQSTMLVKDIVYHCMASLAAFILVTLNIFI